MTKFWLNYSVSNINVTTLHVLKEIQIVHFVVSLRKAVL
jgi:hypothetical protein